TLLVAAVYAVLHRLLADRIGLPRQGADSPVLVVAERNLQRVIRRLGREAEGLAPRAPNALRVLGLHAPVVSLATRQQAGAGQGVLRLALVRRPRDQLVEVRRQRPPHILPVGEHEVVVGDLIATGVLRDAPAESEVRAIGLAAIGRIGRLRSLRRLAGGSL